jgi:hypothetical protein
MTPPGISKSSVANSHLADHIKKIEPKLQKPHSGGG